MPSLSKQRKQHSKQHNQMVRKFLQKWRTLRAFNRSNGYPNPPEWSDVDTEALRIFFSSTTGRKLNSSLLSLHLHQLEKLISSSGSNLAYDAGWAAGFKGALASIDGLMVRQPEKVPDANGATDDLEWMTGPRMN